jgi:hypothetical protein
MCERRSSAGFGRGDPDAALHTGLGPLGETPNPRLILRAHGQQGVRRLALASLPLWEPPGAAPTFGNLFTDLASALARDPRAPLGPIPPGGESPGLRSRPGTPEDLDTSAGPRDPTREGGPRGRRLRRL